MTNKFKSINSKLVNAKFNIHQLYFNKNMKHADYCVKKIMILYLFIWMKSRLEDAKYCGIQNCVYNFNSLVLNIFIKSHFF